MPDTPPDTVAEGATALAVLIADHVLAGAPHPLTGNAGTGIGQRRPQPGVALALVRARRAVAEAARDVRQAQVEAATAEGDLPESGRVADMTDAQRAAWGAPLASAAPLGLDRIPAEDLRDAHGAPLFTVDETEALATIGLLR